MADKLVTKNEPCSKKLAKRDPFAYFSKNIPEYEVDTSDSEGESSEAPAALQQTRDVSFISKSSNDAEPTGASIGTQGTVSNTSTSPSRMTTASDRGEKAADKSKPSALPSATVVFETASKPDFLAKKQADVNWDKLAKNKLGNSTEIDVANIDSHNVPPPQSYDSQSANLGPTLGVFAIEDAGTGTKRTADDVLANDDVDSKKLKIS